MLNFLRKSRSGKAAVAALAAVAVLSLAGCGQEKAAAPQATLVRSMQVSWFTITPALCRLSRKWS